MKISFKKYLNKRQLNEQKVEWIITKDIISRKFGDTPQDGTQSPGSMSKKEIIQNGTKFKMYDDDGNLCYIGYSTDSSSESAFSPLDDFGSPNSGCTRIDYFENGKWETL